MAFITQQKTIYKNGTGFSRRMIVLLFDFFAVVACVLLTNIIIENAE